MVADIGRADQLAVIIYGNACSLEKLSSESAVIDDDRQPMAYPDDEQSLQC